METSVYPIVTDTCPCGAGKVLIDIVMDSNDWTSSSSWSSRITCPACAAAYVLVDAGRGVDLIRAADHQNRLDLMERAEREEVAFIESDKAQEILDRTADRLESEPTVAAMYRLAKQLKLETATEGTFRKHVRDVPMRKWLGWRIPTSYRARESLLHLEPLFRFFEVEESDLTRCIAETEVLREKAQEIPDAVKSWGPINWMAATGEMGRIASALRSAQPARGGDAG